METSCLPESLPSNSMKAIQELTQSQHLINKLQEMLDRPKKIESDPILVDDVGKIIGMFDNTISILNFSTFNDIRTDDMKSTSRWDDQKLEDSGESAEKLSPKAKRGCYKRRYYMFYIN